MLNLKPPGGVPNNGYVLVPNTHYSVENFAGTPPKGLKITQTQAIGINNDEAPRIVGFWADQNGVQYGWQDDQGKFTTVIDPHGPKGQNQNLLGVNDRNMAAGFWVDTNGNEHGFVVNLNSKLNPNDFIQIPPSTFGQTAVATQASGINDNDVVCGFWVSNNNKTNPPTPIDHGFVRNLRGKYTSFMVHINGLTAVSTQVLGCSRNFIVGSFVDPQGRTHGFLSDINATVFYPFDALDRARLPSLGCRGPS